MSTQLDPYAEYYSKCCAKVPTDKKETKTQVQRSAQCPKCNTIGRHKVIAAKYTIPNPRKSALLGCVFCYYEFNSVGNCNL